VIAEGLMHITSSKLWMFAGHGMKIKLGSSMTQTCVMDHCTKSEGSVLLH
jgi:hypothetical protein